jgi:starch phosphorylase
MEFGLDENLPLYAGGLGVLAGDFLRSAKAVGAPVVGVGLVWGDGYTTQRLDGDGKVEDLPTPLPRALLQREPHTVEVTIEGKSIELAIFRVDALDNAPLYLLEPKDAKHRWITSRLYGGSEEDRVAQEIILGIGGVRALEALGFAPSYYHFNEGHAAFAGLELIRRRMAMGDDFATAWNDARQQIVFTTHTPVPAGNESHDLARLEKMGATLGLSHDKLTAIGGQPFGMTVAGLRLSHRSNAVAELHGHIARKMWAHVEGASPIVAITNGVDPRVWQDHRVRENAGWATSLLQAHQQCKRELIAEIWNRTGRRLSDKPLLIGFARRATAYKRALLIAHEKERFEALLDSGQLQLVYAGKAHPRDMQGRGLVAEMAALAEKYPGAVAFIPNYDLRLGRMLTRGCDVWLNTPRRPLEACGTSGMKAAMNGVLNLSILDGWWPEGCDHGKNGWRIGGETSDAEDQKSLKADAMGEIAALDARDAVALHDLLEKSVLPTYANRAGWAEMMQASIAMASERFSSDRMVRSYFEQLYQTPIA